MADPTGWMPGVARIPSNEWGYPDIAEDGMYPQGVINHAMQGFRSTMDAWAIKNESQGRSAHFGVNRKGEIAQYVSIWNPAYHAGSVVYPDGWGQTMLGRHGANPNKWSIGIECEGFSQVIAGADYVYSATNPWPESMVQAVIGIHLWVFSSCEWLVNATDKQDRVLTHSQFDTRTRANDPGALWIANVKPRVIQALVAPPIVIPEIDPRLMRALALLDEAHELVSKVILRE